MSETAPSLVHLHPNCHRDSVLVRKASRAKRGLSEFRFLDSSRVKIPPLFRRRVICSRTLEIDRLQASASPSTPSMSGSMEESFSVEPEQIEISMAPLLSQKCDCRYIQLQTGHLGCLAHPALSAGSSHSASGNYRLLDQNCLSSMDRRNIKAFGDDPSNVTIGGHCACAFCVGLHLYESQSKGLFHRAIPQSGLRHFRDPLILCLALSYRSKEQAESEEQMILAEMKAMNLDKLLEGNHRIDIIMWGVPPLYRACLDRWLFPQTYEDTLLQGTMRSLY